MSTNPLILSGATEADLQSPQALTIVAAAIQAQVSLTRQVSATPVPTPKTLTPPVTPSSSTVVLEYGEELQMPSLPSALRFLGQLAPARGLSGQTPVEEASVSAWLSYSVTSLALPLQVLQAAGDSKAAKKDWDTAWLKVDAHLQFRTYLVGQALTAADLALAVLLYAYAATTEAPENVKRWYETIIHQDCFVAAVQAIKTPVGSSTPMAATTAAASAAAPAGVQQLSGVPTPVMNRLYKRHRMRIKEVFSAAESLISGTGTEITVAGWARTIRKSSSKLFFVELNDGSCAAVLQCVLSAELTNTGFEESKLSGGTGASFQFKGLLIKSTGSEQAFELQVTDAVLLGAVYGNNLEGTEVGGMLYPMAKKEHTLEHMRDVAHLRPRGALHAAAMRVRHAMAFATHNFFHSHGFLYIHTPILTGADCEGAGEQFAVTTMFGSDHLKPDIQIPVVPEPEQKELSKSEQKRLAKQKAKAKVDPTKPVEESVVGAIDYSKDFFTQRVNLTVSGQLNVETHACALSDVYTFGPTFRAEESRTYRHLSEFWMIEPEIAFSDLTDDINLAEDYLKYCVQYALENCAEELEFFEKTKFGEVGLRDRLRNVLDNDFKRLTYTEAIELLQKAVASGDATFEVEPVWGIDLPSEHERYLCEKIFKKPTVLTDYPKEIKAFYMKVNPDNKTVAAADILVPKIGEIIGGSQREHRFDVLKERCVEMGLDPRAVWWYLDLRRYGTVPHAGFGLGFERLILFITGLDNIRDVIPFPRWVGNAKF